MATPYKYDSELFDKGARIRELERLQTALEEELNDRSGCDRIADMEYKLLDHFYYVEDFGAGRRRVKYADPDMVENFEQLVKQHKDGSCESEELR